MKTEAWFTAFYNALVQQKSRLFLSIKSFFTIPWQFSRIPFYWDSCLTEIEQPFTYSRNSESENRNFVPRLSLISVKWKEMAGEITKAINESKRRTWTTWMWFELWLIQPSHPPPGHAGHSARQTVTTATSCRIPSYFMSSLFHMTVL